jgi:hypothetical protein
MKSELADGAGLHAKYDAIWVGCFEALAKVLPEASAKAIAEAVKAGSGFVITGGDGSFHGGHGHAAVIEGTALDAVLPVEISGYADLTYATRGMDDSLATVNAIHDIAAGNAFGNGESSQALELLRHYGLPGFNLVAPRASARTELTISGKPLLVTGTYGTGKTAAFTGFTLASDNYSAEPIDEYLIDEPAARAYFEAYEELLARVLPGAPPAAPSLLHAHEEPLFQTLKEQPQTQLVLAKLDPHSSPASSSRRIQVTNKGGYAHLVHMRFEWPQTGPKPYVAELSDNDFELMPNETREIDLTWRSSTPSETVAGTLVVNAVNAPESRLAF